MLKPIGYWHGCKSILDGKPIIVVFTGFARKSENGKTGPMIQSWILRARVNPQKAVKTGQDVSVCGDCRQRPINGGKCYVPVARAPLAVWKAWKTGRYSRLQLDGDVETLEAELTPFRGRILRIGSYGDPVAVPCDVWDRIIGWGRLAGHTGYTHSWRHPQAVNFSDFLMASVDSPSEFLEASRAGWRCFRTRQAGDGILPGEFVCPASLEAGHKTTCSRCLACNGKRSHRVIVEHGFRARKAVKS